ALADRLRSLRASRQAAGEPAAAVDAAVAALGDAELAVLAPALATCQLWYCEAATGGLSPPAQLAVLAAARGAARAVVRDAPAPRARSASMCRGRGTHSCTRWSVGSAARARRCATGCGSSRPRSPGHRSASY